MNVLFESYFKRLSREEQEAFVCLSVFVSEVFDEKAAVNVIGGDEGTEKKTLLRLKRKYLVEENSSQPVLFSFHPLIRSFGSVKAADMKEIAREAERRFLSYYVKFFEDLNNQFRAGNSLLAFRTLAAFFVTSCQLAFSYSLNFDQQDYIVKKMRI